MTNPWRESKPFDDMFVDEIQLSGTNGQLSCNACVFPIEDVDPFIESTNTTSIRQINVLVRLADLSSALSSYGRPSIGDYIAYGDFNWSVSDVEKEQTWYKMIARSKS